MVMPKHDTACLLNALTDTRSRFRRSTPTAPNQQRHQGLLKSRWTYQLTPRLETTLARTRGNIDWIGTPLQTACDTSCTLYEN